MIIPPPPLFLVLAILVRSLIAAFRATSDLSCHEGIGGEGPAVATTESGDVENEDAGEEGRPTEAEGS